MTQPSAAGALPAAPSIPTVSADELRARLHLHLIDAVGAVTHRRLLAHFGSAEAALRATEADLRDVDGIGPAKAKAIAKGRSEADPDAELAAAERLGAAVVTPDSPDYPVLLRHIHDPPAILFIRGRPPKTAEADSLAVAVVGSRECSDYGREQANRLAGAMAAAGITVVSGLAKGIDTAAHRGAMAAPGSSGGGRTIAVLGSGLGKVYPPENRKLADEIADGRGLVVSEFACSAGPQPHHFPMRNRIISGLSLGVLVVEAPPKSGSLITASVAVEQNREVFAVPGRIDTQHSRGCHELIKNGAKLVESLEDILDALGEAGRLLRQAAEAARPAAPPATAPATAATTPTTSPAPTPKAKPAAPLVKLAVDEGKLFDALSAGPADVDTLVRATGLSAAEVNITLTRLELKGLVKAVPGGGFARR